MDLDKKYEYFLGFPIYCPLWLDSLPTRVLIKHIKNIVALAAVKIFQHLFCRIKKQEISC